MPWLFNWWFGAPNVSEMTITIEGRCATMGQNGVNEDSVRTIIAKQMLNSQIPSANVSYVFEETQVS